MSTCRRCAPMAGHATTSCGWGLRALQGRVAEERPDEGCRLMDPISIKYTGAPFPSRGPDRVCFVIAVEQAAQHALNFVHRPGAVFSH